MTQPNKETATLPVGLTREEISLRETWLKFNENDKKTLKEEVDQILTKRPRSIF